MTSKKSALLRAAKELFGEFGYADTTFKKISQRAGVALGLLTHHYGSKEKLFLAAGLDVLENFLALLTQATANSSNGFQAVMNFCQSYLDFTIDPQNNWLVLVRCSPYSDIKATNDRKLMLEGFAKVHNLLKQQLELGIQDGSILAVDAEVSTQIIISVMVGANRTQVLTPYAPQNLYQETLEFIARAIKAQKA